MVYIISFYATYTIYRKYLMNTTHTPIMYNLYGYKYILSWTESQEPLLH